MTKLRIIMTNGQEHTLVVNELLAIDGVKYDPNAAPPEPISLTELENRVRILEAALGYTLHRIGEVEFIEEGSEPPATTQG